MKFTGLTELMVHMCEMTENMEYVIKTFQYWVPNLAFQNAKT